jgi:hypothetical protein
LNPIARSGHVVSFRSASAYRDCAKATRFVEEHSEDVSTRVAATWPSIVRAFLRNSRARPTQAALSRWSICIQSPIWLNHPANLDRVSGRCAALLLTYLHGELNRRLPQGSLRPEVIVLGS